MKKYKNREIATPDGKFDSRKEFDRWLELRLLERGGAIQNLRRQVKYDLLPPIYETYERYSEKTGKRLKDGKRFIEHGVSYVADFVYEKDGETVVEDTKGVRTEAYIIKRKLMLYFHGIRIKEV